LSDCCVLHVLYSVYCPARSRHSPMD
jgi:hypothetical protein